MFLITLSIIFVIIANSHEFYICKESTYPDYVVQIPKPIACSSSKYTTTDIRVKKLNDKEYTTPAIILNYVNYVCESSASITFKWTPKKTITYKLFSRDDILSMNSSVAFNEKKFNYDVNSGQFEYGTDEFKCEYYVFYSRTSENSYITLRRDTMRYVAGQMFTGFGTVPECKYEYGYCDVSNWQHIVWQVNKDALNEYNILHVNAHMIYDTNNNIHLGFVSEGQNVSVVVTNITDIDKDGYIKTSNIAYKVKFLKNVKDDDGNHIIKTDAKANIKRHIMTSTVSSNVKYVIRPTNRHKRDITYSDDATDLLQDIYDHTSSQNNIITELCNEISTLNNEIFALCTTNAKACISSLLSKIEIKVTIIGDKYLVNDCINATIKLFLPSQTHDNLCSVFPKINYTVLANPTILTGYVNPATGEIFASTHYTHDCTSIITPCITEENSLCEYDPKTGIVNKKNIYTTVLSKSSKITYETTEYNHNYQIRELLFDDVANVISANVDYNYYPVQETKVHVSIPMISMIIIFTFIFTFIIATLTHKYIMKLFFKNKSNNNKENIPMLNTKCFYNP